MKKILLFIVSGLLWTWSLSATETIKVGGYVFPPFVEKLNDQHIGITIDLINELNKFQQAYRFEFVTTSPKRRYADFETGRFDIIMFEDKNWGWKDKPVVSSKVFLKGGEVYITKADPSKDQSYFDNLKGKSFAVMLGYHYGFANFNADETYLKNNFDIQLGSMPDANILKVLIGRSDISVVTLSYLHKFLKKNPDKKSQLLISVKMDQEYNHTILVGKKGKIDLQTINTLLLQIKDAGILDRVLKNYGFQ
ncbi:MAG: transporter substrate-binding domain-containing protein [Desulfobacteraceae bacterium]|nr:transporter substrate-binding domain-containing protein [Desulfobacteraceae bacterium]